MRIEGILLPSDWDDEGRITALVLATSDEGEFQIDCPQAPIRLEKYLRQKVIVDGKLAGANLIRMDTITVGNLDRPQVGTGLKESEQAP
jgi:hypothetical protein